MIGYQFGWRVYLSQLTWCSGFFQRMTPVLTVVMVMFFSGGVNGQAFQPPSWSAFNQKVLLGYKKPPVKWSMSGQAQAELNEGFFNLESGNPAAAAGDFEKVISIEPALEIAYYFKGVSERLAGDFKGAITTLSKISEHSGLGVHSKLEMGKTMHMAGQLQKAYELYQVCTEDSDTKEHAFILMGALQLQFGNIAEAKEQFLKCLEFNLHNNEAIVRLVAIHLTEQDWRLTFDQSKDDLARILATDSLHAEALYYNALIQMDSEPKVAIRNLNTLVRLVPNAVDIQLMRGSLFVNEKDFDRAFSDFHHAIQSLRTDPNKVLGKQTSFDKVIDLQYADYYTLAHVYGMSDGDASKVKEAFSYLVTRQYQPALDALNSIEKIETDPLCLYLRGLCFEHSGQHQKAWDSYEKALSFDGEIIDAWKKVGIYNTNQNNWEVAEKNFSRVLELDDQQRFVNKLRGVTYYFLKKYNSCVSDFTVYLQYDSLDESARVNRATCYEKLRQKENAKLDIMKIAQDKKVIFSRLKEGFMLQLQEGDTARVLERLNLLAVSINNPYAYEFRFDLLMRQGRTKEVNDEIRVAILMVTGPGYEKLLSRFMVIEGKMYLKKNEELAVYQFTQAAKVDPRNDLAYLELAKVQLRQKHETQARKNLKMSSSMGNKDAAQLLRTLEGK